MKFDLIKTKNGMGYESTIPKEEFKNILLNLKSGIKFKNLFIEEYFNTTFGIVILENLLVLSEYLLKQENSNIILKTELDYSVSKENYIMRMEIQKFYGTELFEMNEEEISKFLEEIDPLEEEVLEEYLKRLFNDGNCIERVTHYVTTTDNIDDLIRGYKKENEQVKKQALSNHILIGLFDVHAPVVKRDLLLKEYSVE